MNTKEYIEKIEDLTLGKYENPWEITENIITLILEKQKTLNDDYVIKNDVAVHKTAIIEQNVIIKGPVIISENSVVAANCYLRDGVYIGSNVKIGPSCEIKQSAIFDNTSLAHLNYAGNSIIGSNVNMEASSILANHFNEREDKTITLHVDNDSITLPVTKFGAIVSDGTKIGANAVTSPGTFLAKNSVVKRLALVE